VLRAVQNGGGVPDGALLAFVQATDPELILLLEVRRTETGTNGTMRWRA
jgi:hypothetical protein